MKGVILASHGEFANGLYDTAKLFFGEQEQMKALCLHAGDAATDFEQKLKDAINEVDSGEGVYVLVDLMGGTPCNCMGRILMGGENRDIRVMAGMNLGMLLQLLAMRSSMDVSQEDLTSAGKDAVVDYSTQVKAMLNNKQ